MASPQKEKICLVILAAGQSRRMGDKNKLLEKWNSRPLIEYACQAAEESQCTDILLVTGHQHQAVSEAAAKFGFREVYNSNYKKGIASSIIAGVLEAKKLGSIGILFLLGDMPDISPENIDQIIEFGKELGHQSIVVPSFNGKRGNPVQWPRLYFDELLELEGDTGARQIMQRNEKNIVELDLGAEVKFDLDTPQEFKTSSNKL